MTEVEQLKKRIKELERDNETMAKLLSAKYTAKSLFFGSSIFALAFFCSLLHWFFEGTYVVHPYIAGVGLFASISFVILSLWRIRDEREQKDG